MFLLARFHILYHFQKIYLGVWSFPIFLAFSTMSSQIDSQHASGESSSRRSNLRDDTYSAPSYLVEVLYIDVLPYNAVTQFGVHINPKNFGLVESF